MEDTFKKLSELIGKGGRVEESEKSIKRKKEKFFLDIISILCEIEAYQKNWGILEVMKKKENFSRALSSK